MTTTPATWLRKMETAWRMAIVTMSTPPPALGYDSKMRFLGSTSITDDGVRLPFHLGSLLSKLQTTEESRLSGAVRASSGQGPTDYKYTGQRDPGWGLYHFKARWYDSHLGRFAQADTDVPESQGVQGFDRYAFVNNNPMRYTDPTGHRACRTMEECEDLGTTPMGGDWADLYFSRLKDPYTKFPSDLSISQEGLDFIRSQEGLYLQLYNDGNQLNDPFFYNVTGGGQGNCTIGYGHLVHTGPCNGDSRETDFTNGITNNKADEMLRNDVLPAEQGVRKYVKVKLTQPQYDALVSLIFNWGIDNFRASPKLSLLNNGEYVDMAVHLRQGPLGANGQIYPGLVRRREAELLMFLTMVDRP